MGVYGRVPMYLSFFEQKDNTSHRSGTSGWRRNWIYPPLYNICVQQGLRSDLKQRQIPLQLPLGDVHAVGIQLCLLVGDEGVKDVLSQGLSE